MFKFVAFCHSLTGSGGPRNARNEENVDLVNDLVLRQKDTPQTYRTVREILIISRDVMKLPP